MSFDDIYLMTKIVLGVLLIGGTVMTGLWKWCPRIKSIFIGKKTITLVNNDTGHINYWHAGSQAGKPILQVNCTFMVTNITDRPVALARAGWKGGISGNVEYSQISVKDLHSKYWGTYDVPARARTNVSVCFIITPKKCQKQALPSS